MKWKDVRKKQRERKAGLVASESEKSEEQDHPFAHYGPSSGGDTIVCNSNSESTLEDDFSQYSDAVVDRAGLESLLEEEGFLLLRMLGKGGMGSVYSVEDIALQARVALKVVHDELLSSNHYQHRFVEEARAAAFLMHPNIPPVHHMGL